MTSEFNARSFDRPRERAAPSSLRGHWLDDEETTLDLTELTLIITVKSNCDGCRELLNGDLAELPMPVLFVSANDDDSTEWRDARRPVFVSPDAFSVLEVRSSPFYVLVDPRAQRVVTEGVPFGVSQVVTEIAAHL